MSGVFKKGYSAVREEKQRQDDNRAKMGKRLWRFFLSKDGDEAVVRFLTEEPINFYEHTIKTVRNGKEVYDTVICSGDDRCDLCNRGEKPTFKGAFLMYDKREFTYKDKDGKEKTAKGQLRLYVQGTRVLSQLDRLSERYGLTKRDYTITRSGSGTSTTYMFDRADDVSKVTKEEIANMLPEKLREEYDGTIESLYEIVINQLQMDLDGDDDKEEKEKDTEEYDARKNLIGDDDDEDDSEDVDDEDIPFKKTSLIKKTGLKKSSMFKSKKENSVKPLFRTKK